MTQDPEIQAMMEITKALGGLEPEAQARTLKWAAERFQVKVAIGGPGGGVSTKSKEREQDSSSGAEDYDDFASLYDAADPKTAVDKAAVGAYWLQVIGNTADFDATSLNTELKHLGHGSSNITRDLDALITRSPRLVIQVRKSGSSRQARKKYKLTTEGVRAVERMLTGHEGGADTE